MKSKGKTGNASVRFNISQLDFLKKTVPGIQTPQQAVDFLLDEFYRAYHPSTMKVLQYMEHAPTKEDVEKYKKQAGKVLKSATGSSKQVMVQVTQNDLTKHPLWQPNDPREGTMSFMNKYGVMSYDELQDQRDEERKNQPV